MTFFYDLNKKLSELAVKPQPQNLNEGAEPVYEKYQGFEKLEKEISQRGDVRDPAAVAASIGRKKYGKAAFQKAAAAGKKLGEDPNEGNEFAGELAKARASGAKEFRVGDKTYPVKEAAKKDKPFFPQPGADDEKTAFRKKFAPSVMRDPAAKGEVEKLDRDLERLKKMRRGELDPDDMGDEPPAGEKRGRGRPKKYTADRPRQERVTAKARKADRTAWTPDRKKQKVKEQEGVAEDYDQDEYDEEGEMAQSQTSTIADAAMELQDMLTANENLPEWVQKKITLAKEYIDSARDYLKANRPEDSDMEESALQAHIGRKKYGKAGMAALQQAGREGAGKEKMAKIRAQHDKLDEEDLEEKAVSKAQRAAAGIARAAQKGKLPKSELRGASREMAKMPAGELRKFAKTKEKGLPEKVREVDTGEADARKTTPSSKEHNDEVFAKHRERTNKERRDHDKESDEKPVKETTTAGSVATAPAAGENKSKGGMQFGKGIYDSMNRELEQMIAESMSVNMSTNTDPQGGPTQSITVTATDEDAIKLASILNLAGLGSQAQDSAATCDACGQAPCGCAEMVDENQPDWPTDTEISDDALQYSGGLNKPKSTGQTTTPVIAGQEEREHAYDDSAEIMRLREMAGIVREASKKKPDFPDLDDDGDRTEPISKAAKDREQKVKESIEGDLWNLFQRLQ
jgi:hypothetical protein